MQRVNGARASILLAMALVLMAATSLTTLRFVADGPGADLEGVGNADTFISLIQGQEHVFWMSLAGRVTQVTAWGWPVSDGEVELGGGVVITRPDGGQTGAIDFGEKPMALSFETTG